MAQITQVRILRKAIINQAVVGEIVKSECIIPSLSLP